MTTALELLRGCLKPGLTMAALLFGPATLAGWAAADLATPLAAAGWGVLVGVTGLLAHEGAHLWLARRLGGPDAARLRTSWLGLSVDAPGLHPQHSAAVALVGPLAGAAVSVGIAALTPAPVWIATAFAGVHLLNLVPVRRTDGAVALHAGCAGLVRRWDLERAQLETAQKEGATGGQ